ncbi:MAG: DNRLRE domain-containing protein [bacterium]|nr:DNRLRE domain-containing protein [bacterium]
MFSCQKESNIEIRTEATTIAKIYQPDAAVGKDIVIQSITADDVFFNSDYLAAMSWTNAGNFNTSRVLIEFDFSDIPAETQIDSASLSLFWVSSDNLTGQTGENAFSIYKITESWQESSVTWNNQPTTSNVDIINIPKSKSEEQSYLNIDVTGLVQDMINNPSDNHGFMLKLDEEFPYKLVIFGSSNYSDASKRPKLVVYLIY